MLMQHTVMIHDDKLFVSTAISVHYSAVLQHHPFHLLYQEEMYTVMSCSRSCMYTSAHLQTLFSYSHQSITKIHPW